MSLYKHYKTDTSAEKDGVWVEFPTSRPDIVAEFLLARAGATNTTYRKEVERIQKRFKRAIELGTMDNEQERELMAKAFAVHVTKDWRERNIKTNAILPFLGEDEKPLAFSVGNVVKLFKDLPDFFDELAVEATKASNYLANQVEEEVKKSAKP